MQRGLFTVLLSASALTLVATACPSTPFQDDEFIRIGERAGSGPCVVGGGSTFLQPAGFLAPIQDDGSVGATHYICEYNHREPDGRPEFDSWEGNTTVINGGSTVISLTHDLGNDDEGNPRPFENRGVIVGVVGELGYFYRPIEAADDTLELDLHIVASLPNTRTRYTVFVGINDLDAPADVLSAGSFQEIPIDVTPVNSGELQVSLTWDTSADMDLYVTEPGGETIFWGYTEAESGGTLDLDGNAACEVADERNENIYWPAGTAASGEYLVEVVQFDPCNTADRTNWRVTVLANGQPTVYSGSVNPDDLDAVEVTTVDWMGR